MLEQQLDQVDHNETSPIFLGKSRSDRNKDRSSTLHLIDRKLVDYGVFYSHLLYKIIKLTLTRLPFGKNVPDDEL